MKPLSLYIHWPFCAAKCPYCDFNSRPLTQDLDEDAWCAAYLAELTHYAERLSGRPVATIYFGGGTPSLMRESTIAAIVNKIAALWPVQHNCEITIEANPSSSEISKFRAFKTAGVNRVSIGVQALNDEDLRFLGRTHNKNAAREAIESAQKTFDRFSFDLIYARRGQTPEAWARELQEALAFAPSHLSVYQLTIEEGTVFYKRARRETLQADEESSALMFEQTQEILRAAGLPAYEISNHAAVGQESRHNLTYWHYDDYVGIGPGAHGRFVEDGERLATENIKHPYQWLQQTVQQNHGRVSSEVLDGATAQREALMMGLRLAKGIDAVVWHEKFGVPLETLIPSAKTQLLVDEGLAVWQGSTFRATASGLQRLNAILRHLLTV